MPPKKGKGKGKGKGKADGKVSQRLADQARRRAELDDSSGSDCEVLEVVSVMGKGGAAVAASGGLSSGTAVDDDEAAAVTALVAMGEDAPSQRRPAQAADGDSDSAAA